MSTSLLTMGKSRGFKLEGICSCIERRIKRASNSKVIVSPGTHLKTSIYVADDRTPVLSPGKNKGSDSSVTSWH